MRTFEDKSSLFKTAGKAESLRSADASERTLHCVKQQNEFHFMH